MTLSLTEEDQNFLEHYVAKGMKWGVRRSQAQLDRAAGRKQARQDRRTETQRKVKSPSRAPGQTVKSAKRRATAGNAARTAGKVIVTNILSDVGGNLAYTLTNSPASLAAARAVQWGTNIHYITRGVQTQRDIYRTT